MKKNGGFDHVVVLQWLLSNTFDTNAGDCWLFTDNVQKLSHGMLAVRSTQKGSEQPSESVVFDTSLLMVSTGNHTQVFFSGVDSVYIYIQVYYINMFLATHRTAHRSLVHWKAPRCHGAAAPAQRGCTLHKWFTQRARWNSLRERMACAVRGQGPESILIGSLPELDEGNGQWKNVNLPNFKPIQWNSSRMRTLQGGPRFSLTFPLFQEIILRHSHRNRQHDL